MKKLILCTLVMLTALVACKEKGLGDGGKLVLNKSELKLEQLTTVQLTATNAAAFGSNASFNWQSNNPTVATVDSKGVVTAIAPGTAEIRISVTGERSTLSDPCTITVKTYGAGKISLFVPADSLTLQPGDTIFTASYAFDPLFTPNQAVTIVRSDSIGAKLAKIEVSRVGKAPDTTGLITITANQQAGKLSFRVVSVADTSLKSNIINMVIGGVNITGFDWAPIKEEPIPTAVKSGVDVAIGTEILPANASLRKLTWKSTNEKILSVASINESSAMLVGHIKNGGAASDVVIFAATEQGQMLKRTINVTAADADPVKPVTVELPKSFTFTTKDTIIINKKSYQGIKVTMEDMLTGKVDLLSQMSIGGNLFTNFYVDNAQKAFEVKLLSVSGLTGNIEIQTATVEKTNFHYISAMTLMGELTNTEPGTISKVAVRVDTKDRFDAANGTYAEVSDKTSTFDTLYIKVVKSEMPSSIAIMKSMYTFNPENQDIVISANLTPINASSAMFASAKATLYLKKGTVIAPTDTLKADKAVTAPAAINLASQSGGNYFSGTFAAMKHNPKIGIAQYFVRYSFTSATIKHEFDSALVEQGAPYAPRR